MIGYNIQVANDAKHKLLIPADTGDVNDTKALAMMVKKTQNNIGNVEDVLANKGYHSSRLLKKRETLGVKAYISLKESSSSKQILILQCTISSIIKIIIPTHAQQIKP
jgi:hypothetical protein